MDLSRATELVGGPGIRDADEILARIHLDEREAVEARTRFRVEGLPSIDVDGPVADRLRPGETAVDVRSAAVVRRHLRGDGADEIAGQCILTTQRLIVAGKTPLDVELGDIEELSLAGERLLVTLRDGTGLSIDASRPRLLRVQIAAARGAVRDLADHPTRP